MRLENLFTKIPFFSHFDEKAISEILNDSELIKLNRNDIIQLNDEPFLYILKSGLMTEVDNFDKIISSVLVPGNFWGSIPFHEFRGKVKKKAVYDCEILKIQTDKIYNYFIDDFKSFKSFIENISNFPFNSAKTSDRYLKNETSVITVYSSDRETGKSFISSILARKLSIDSQVLVIDCSYSGKSIAEYFDERIMPPISEKLSNKNKIDTSNYITKINENLEIINLINTSKVKINTDIMSPLLFKMALKYKYIIIDCGLGKSEETKKVFAQSDYIINIDNNKKKDYSFVDMTLNRYQRIINLENIYYTSNGSSNDNSLIVDLHSGKNEEEKNSSALLSHWSEVVKEKINNERRLVIIKDKGLFSICYYGLFQNYEKYFKKDDIILSTGFTFVMGLLYKISKNENEFKNYTFDLFKNERIASLLKPVFPREFIFSNDEIVKYFKTIFKNDRIENSDINMNTILLNSNLELTPFSGGYSCKLCSAALSNYSINQPIDISSDSYTNIVNLEELDLLNNYYNVKEVLMYDAKFNKINIYDDIFTIYVKNSMELCENSLNLQRKNRILSCDFKARYNSIDNFINESMENWSNLI